MSSRVLFVQQDHVSPPGAVGDAFVDHGFEVAEFLVVRRERFSSPGVHVDFPEPTAYDVIVPMGAPWSVYDHDGIGSWIDDELAMLRRADQAGVPVLGICFGGQALAAALGGSVSAGEQAEVGWVEVASDDETLVPAGPWFQWHHDRWHTPPGAVEIARTSVAPQAFVLRQSLGVQFHPEITPEQLRGWLDNGGTRYLLDHRVVPEQLLAATVARRREAAERTHRLVTAFLHRVAGSRTASRSCLHGYRG